MTYGLVPVKDMSKAKERLSPVLSLAERTALAFAMLEDVLGALKSSGHLGKLFVITLDESAVELANSMDIEVIREKTQESESGSVDYGSRICKELGAESVLVIPGDAPLITAEDVDFILERGEPFPSIILVPARDELGTNAILRRPPDIIPSRFGYDSFRKHIFEADKIDIPHYTYNLPRVALDIDEPRDLAFFASKESDTKSYRELAKIGVIKKVTKIIN